MHFCMWVILPPKAGEIHGIVEKMLKPHEDSLFDWYQIGGRWSGMLDPTYDPETDPANIETCKLCGGTGMRNDTLGREARERNPAYTCNGCNGKGKSVKWPTQWRENAPGNVEYLGEVKKREISYPYCLLLPDGTLMFSESDMPDGFWEDWNEEKQEIFKRRREEDRELWKKTCSSILSKYNDDNVVVVVDYHG